MEPVELIMSYSVCIVRPSITVIYTQSPSRYEKVICIAPPQTSGFAANDAVVGEGVLSS